MSDDKIVFYSIELEHLNDLKAVANRLLSTVTMNTDEMRDAAVKILTAVNYAEVLTTFRTASADGMYVHMTPKHVEEVTESDVGKTFVQGGTSGSFTIAKTDVGKHVYTHDGITRMESDDEFAKRRDP